MLKLRTDRELVVQSFVIKKGLQVNGIKNQKLSKTCFLGKSQTLGKGVIPLEDVAEKGKGHERKIGNLQKCKRNKTPAHLCHIPKRHCTEEGQANRKESGRPAGKEYKDQEAGLPQATGRQQEKEIRKYPRCWSNSTSWPRGVFQVWKYIQPYTCGIAFSI